MVITKYLHNYHLKKQLKNMSKLEIFKITLLFN